MSWECDKHPGLPRATYGPGTERDGCGHCGDNMRLLDDLLTVALEAHDDSNDLWPTDGPFDQGARQGYRDQLAGRVTRDAHGAFASIPTPDSGALEYGEGYTEGVEQAEVDQRAGRL